MLSRYTLHHLLLKYWNNINQIKRAVGTSWSRSWLECSLIFFNMTKNVRTENKILKCWLLIDGCFLTDISETCVVTNDAVLPYYLCSHALPWCQTLLLQISCSWWSPWCSISSGTEQWWSHCHWRIQCQAQRTQEESFEKVLYNQLVQVNGWTVRSCLYFPI